MADALFELRAATRLLGPALVVAGDVIGSLYVEEIPDKAFSYPYKMGSLIAGAAGLSVLSSHFSVGLSTDEDGATRIATPVLEQCRMP